MWFPRGGWSEEDAFEVEDFEERIDVDTGTSILGSFQIER
jgi:hypothetical protein